MMAINQVCHERQLPLDIVLEAVEVALISAYKRNYGGNSAITAQIDSKSGAPLIFVEKAVVDEVENEKNEITLEEAKQVNPYAEIGGLVSIENTPANFGRIAAQTAKQVILQRIREAEREALYSAYAEREGEIVSGTVHKIEPHQVTLSLGKVEAILPRSEQIPTERYSESQRLRAYVSSVIKASRGPQIIVSRTHRNMLRRLLEVEVPEIYNGTVEIKSIAREAGFRSKVAVAALQEGVDPVGSCVGMRGTRIQNIVNELNGEKIDVVQWNPDLSFFIANSLSPAKVMNVMLHDEQDKTAVVVVPDKQLSLAIGKEGQNARLAAKLTGWRIDIKSVSEAAEEILQKIEIEPNLQARVADKTEIFNRARTVLEEKTPLEYTENSLKILSEAIEAVNLAEMAMARERKEAEAKKAEAKKAQARDLLAEAEAILSGQPPAQEEEEPEVVEVADVEIVEEAPQAEEAIEEAETIEAEVMVAEEEEEEPPSPEEEAAVEVEAELEEEPTDDYTLEEEEADEDEDEEADEDEEEEGEWDEFGIFHPSDRKEARRKARRKKRRLVYDERLGEVVVERRRKRSRRTDDWLDEYDENF